tara:strand:+ start:1158 stop:1877 length:720 start_codon:yes stop_codon:yes gene_type:complete
MGYFRELPNIQYQSPFSNRVSSASYITAKNLFRRMKIRDDLQNVFTIFNKYEIDDGDRPDTVARDLYGKSSLDWVVLTTAGIINVRDGWPLPSKELYNLVVERYGLTEINKVRHYETKEIKDSRGVIVQPAGKIIDEKKQDGTTTDENGKKVPNMVDYYIDYYDNNVNKRVSGSNARSGVTYYEYEQRLNDKKRNIFVLRREYLQQFLNDIKNEMTYKKSSQFVNSKLVKTENTRVTIG